MGSTFLITAVGKRQEARGIMQDLSPTQKQQVLQPLAYFMMQQGIREIAFEVVQQVIAPPLSLVSTRMQPADFLLLVENTSGLLLERNPGFYGFAHLTFQEYLAAVHIKEEGLEQVLVTQVANSWWHETIRLYCGQSDATVLIMACLAANPPTIAALTLALECEEEKLKIQQQVQSQLNALLETGVEDPDPEHRHIIAEALLTRRLRRMVHLRRDVSIDTSLITCAEYQLFLDEQNEQKIFCQPDHWQTLSFPTGQGNAPVLGVRYEDAQAFCSWLTKHEAGLWRYLLPNWDKLNDTHIREMMLLQVATTTGYWTEDGTVMIRTTPYTPEILIDRCKEQLEASFDLDCDITNVLDRDIANALDRANASVSALDHTLSHNHADALATTFTRDLASALDRDLASTLVRDLAGAHDIARACACELARLFTRDLTNASYLARTFVITDKVMHTFDTLIDLARDLDTVGDLARVRIHTIDRDPELISNLKLDLYRIHAYNRRPYSKEDPQENSREDSRFLGLCNILTRISLLIHALGLALDLLLVLEHLNTDKLFPQTQQAILCRRYVRFAAVTLSRSLRRYILQETSSKFSNLLKRLSTLGQGPSELMVLENSVRGFLDIALAFALIEQRIEGRLAAWEGILLVKEHTVPAEREWPKVAFPHADVGKHTSTGRRKSFGG